MEVTTNSLENINLKLKRHLGHGYLSEKNAYRKLKSFQEAQIALYTSCICNNGMNKIKPKTLEREENLIMRLENYCDLDKIDQINNLDYFATEIGCYASDYNADYFGKAPNLTLNEVQEHEGDSFLSLKDILSALMFHQLLVYQVVYHTS